MQQCSTVCVGECLLVSSSRAHSRAATGPDRTDTALQLSVYIISFLSPSSILSFFDCVFLAGTNVDCLSMSLACSLYVNCCCFFLLLLSLISFHRSSFIFLFAPFSVYFGAFRVGSLVRSFTLFVSRKRRTRWKVGLGWRNVSETSVGLWTSWMRGEGTSKIRKRASKEIYFLRCSPFPLSARSTSHLAGDQFHLALHVFQSLSFSRPSPLHFFFGQV